MDKLEQEFPSPMELKGFPNKYNYEINRKTTLGSSVSDWWSNPDYWGSSKVISSLEALEERKEKITQLANQYIQDCQAVWESNLPAIENNKAIVEKVKNIMRGLGVKDSYSHSYFKSAKSMERTTETRYAGYIDDLNRTFKTSQPSVPKFNDVVGHYFDGYNSKYEQIKKEIIEKAHKEDQERKAKEAAHGIALLRAKYTPDDAMSEIADILDTILGKCKYLRLAHFLEKNRGDWSDGYTYAEWGIDGFTIDTPEDQEIYNEISGIIEDGNNSGDIDGRMFRDCEYNYGVLFGKVDSNLYGDYQKVKGLLSDGDY